VPITTEFKALNRPEQLSIIFYIISGIFLLALLPFSSFAPHIALIGIFSLITGIIILVRNDLAILFVAIQFITVMAFTLWSIYALGTGNWPVTAVLAVYAILDIAATLCIVIWRKNNSSV